MKHGSMLKLILTVVVIALCASGADAARPPNFVIIFIDDMGWRDWSGNGSDYLETPNIDQIGKDKPRNKKSQKS